MGFYPQFRKFYIPHKNAPNSTTSRFKINGPLKRHAVDQILRQRLTIFWSKTSKAFTFSKKHLDYVAKNRFETILSECTFIFHSKSFCPIFHVTVGTFIPLLSRTFYGTDATKKTGKNYWLCFFFFNILHSRLFFLLNVTIP